MFEVTTANNGPVLNVHIKGYINEHATFDNVQIYGYETVDFDFDGVTMINSIGISKWVKWIDQALNIEAPPKITFSRCTKSVMDQVNSVIGFLPEGAIISSLYVPYFNEEEDSTSEELLIRGKHYHEAAGDTEAWVKLPEKEGFEADIFVEKYFHFLQ